MHLRKTLLQAGAQIEKILKRQVRMQATDDMKLRDRFGISGSCGLEGFLECHGIGTGRVFLASESAQAAGRHTDICRIDMPIDIEIGPVAMHPLADKIGHPSYRENVACPVERKRVG